MELTLTPAEVNELRTLLLKAKNAVDGAEAICPDAFEQTSPARLALSNALLMLPAPMEVEPELEPLHAPRRNGGRCPVFEIRKFHAVAKGAGLDVTNKDAIRAALSKYFDRPILSRRELHRSEWAVAAGAIEAGGLSW